MEFGVYPILTVMGIGWENLLENNNNNKWVQRQCAWESGEVICHMSGTEQAPEIKPEVEVLEGQRCLEEGVSYP